MVKQVLIPIVAVMAFIVLVGLFMQKSSTWNLSKYLLAASPNIQSTVVIDSTTIPVEIAKTPDVRNLGLGKRSSLESNSGMLFVFDEKQVMPSFWMKDMEFPLDFIWISNSKIVKIDKNIQPPAANTPDSKLKTYSGGQPVDYVLEVNGGFSDKNNFKVGDGVTPANL